MKRAKVVQKVDWFYRWDFPINNLECPQLRQILKKTEVATSPPFRIVQLKFNSVMGDDITSCLRVQASDDGSRPYSLSSNFTVISNRS